LPVRLSSFSVPFDGTTCRVLLLSPQPRAPDVERELLTDRLALTGQLAARVAHAISNPLAYVTTNIAYCKERLEYIQALLLGQEAVQIDDPRRLRGLLLPLSEALAEAAVGSSRVGHLARNLKSLSDPPSDGTTIDVAEAMEAALLMCEGACRHRARIRIDRSSTARVGGSFPGLAQVIANLIFSLISTFEEDDPTRNRVTIEVQSQDDQVTIAFSDNGPGFPQKVDTALREATLETWRREDGPVLWLLSARRLTEMMGGTLQLTSIRGSKAHASVRLPLLHAPSSRPPIKLARPRLERKARILVVDNEPLIVRAITRFLGHDYDVDSAENGQEALEVMKDGPRPDLVLCDLLMPEMTGMELYACVLRDSPDLSRRFAFLTGGAYTPETIAFLEESKRPTLNKPLDPQSLRRAVSQLLEALGDAKEPA
jgi:CheY-like chemotaxis protein